MRTDIREAFVEMLEEENDKFYYDGTKLDTGKLLEKIEEEFPEMTQAEYNELEVLTYEKLAEQYKLEREWEAECRYREEEYRAMVWVA